MEEQLVYHRAFYKPMIPFPGGAGFILVHHGDTALVHLNVIGGEYCFFKRFVQGAEQINGVCEPVIDRGGRQVDVLSSEDVQLSVEGQVVLVLAHQQVGQQGGSGIGAGQHLGGKRGDDDTFTLGQSILGTNDPLDIDLARIVFKLLGDFFTNAHSPFRDVFRLNDHLFTTQSLRQGFADRLLASLFPAGIGWDNNLFGFDLLLFRQLVQSIKGQGEL
ncbi:MAG: hypothetical protein BWY72_02490 [Bacteroidetes bacterium ADurb.Bin416]|nr:MAG: hypothetical protein BWY72_02490 [Bacteroidetes bacterium ADurb.Bin416]